MVIATIVRCVYRSTESTYISRDCRYFRQIYRANLEHFADFAIHEVGGILEVLQPSAS